MSRQILVLNGPNLNRLGSRRPEIYGSATLSELEADCVRWGADLDVTVETAQTNHEGVLIDLLHGSASDAVLLNAGALTHYSYALRDAVESIEAPVIEIHISNVMERDEWRRRSVIADACLHSIYGRGVEGYRWGLRHLVNHLDWPSSTLEYGYHDDNLGELRMPDGAGPFPAVVLIHGGFWRHNWTLDTIGGLAVDLARRGVLTYSIEYRRVGAGGGAATTPADIEAAIDALRRHPAVDAERVAVVGHSAGGQLALQAAAREKLCLAVALGGVLDLDLGRDLAVGGGAIDAYLGGAPTRLHSPVHLVPEATPTLVVHGSDDDSVPVALAERYAEAVSVAGGDCDFVALPGVGHFELIDPRHDAWHQTAERIVGALFA